MNRATTGLSLKSGIADLACRAASDQRRRTTDVNVASPGHRVHWRPACWPMGPFRGAIYFGESLVHHLGNRESSFRFHRLVDGLQLLEVKDYGVRMPFFWRDVRRNPWNPSGKHRQASEIDATIMWFLYSFGGFIDKEKTSKGFFVYFWEKISRFCLSLHSYLPSKYCFSICGIFFIHFFPYDTS